MNKIHKAVEKRRKDAQTHLETLGQEQVRFSDQLAACEQTERELRQARANLDDLTLAATRTNAARSLLEQTLSELDPARQELREAEAAEEQERLIAELVAYASEGEKIALEMQRLATKLEPVLAPYVMSLIELQGQLEEARRGFGKAGEELIPDRPQLGIETQFQKAFHRLERGYGDRGLGSVAAMRSIQPPQGAENAWLLLMAVLGRRREQFLAEYNQLPQRERAAFLNGREG